MILLISGTDTGVGKTWTGCALAHALRRVGRRVVAVKPLETGCTELTADREDGSTLARATGQAEPLRALLRLREPVAPAEAADREGVRIDFDDLVRRVRDHAGRADITLVEGAGGILSPLTWEHNALDLARALDADVLLVASDRLGTISQTLTALNVLASSRLPVVGVVLSPPEQSDASTGSNGPAIARISRSARIHAVPRTRDPEVMARSMEEVVGWLNIVQAHLFIAGRVQGVGFRATTQAEARKRGVTGWVRNLADGRVEALLQGPRDQIDDLIRWCHKGPPSARVEKTEVIWETLKEFDGFASR